MQKLMENNPVGIFCSFGPNAYIEFLDALYDLPTLARKLTQKVQVNQSFHLIGKKNPAKTRSCDCLRLLQNWWLMYTFWGYFAHFCNILTMCFGNVMNVKWNLFCFWLWLPCSFFRLGIKLIFTQIYVNFMQMNIRKNLYVWRVHANS